MSLMVAEYDGTNTAGLVLTGTSTDGEIDVTLGAGAASLCNMPGTAKVVGNFYLYDVGGEYISSDGTDMTITSGQHITLTTGGSGEVIVGSGKLTTSGTTDMILDTNSGSSSGSVTIADGANGDITIACNGTGDIECSSDVKTSTTKKVYSKGNCFQTHFHSSLVFGY